jgi:GNAT superfamily N-acetyltransferase
MKELVIRTAQKEDIPIILSFIKKLAEYEKLSHEVTVTNELLEESLFAEDTNAFSIIGYINNKPVTFAIYFFNYSTFLGKKGLYLEDLFVLSEYRNNGVGEKMLKHLANTALENNCGRLEWSVLDWNEPAIQFYKNIGAELKSEWIITRISGKKLNNLANKNL